MKYLVIAFSALLLILVQPVMASGNTANDNSAAQAETARQHRQAIREQQKRIRLEREKLKRQEYTAKIQGK